MKRVGENPSGRKSYNELSLRQRKRLQMRRNDKESSAALYEEATYAPEQEIIRPNTAYSANEMDISPISSNVSMASLSQVDPPQQTLYDQNYVDGRSNISSIEADKSRYDSSGDDEDRHCFEVCSEDLISSSFDEIEGKKTFREKLAAFFVKKRITAEAGDELLALLRSHACFESLPKSTKSLLRTPRHPVALVEVPPGQYLHLGFETALHRILDRVEPSERPSFLEIDFNTDGATLHRSGSNQIWPIQCRIANIKNSPVGVIGVYKGGKKPSDANLFFKLFIDEAVTLIKKGGIMRSGKEVPFQFRAFIADAPARAFILNHHGHTSCNPCSKCRVTGEGVENHVVFIGDHHLLRTDTEYQTKEDEDHHKNGDSPLSQLPMGLVTQVPFEYMHLVLLGVLKRMVSAWLNGKFSMNSKLSGFEISTISQRLYRMCYESIPDEFARPPASLLEILQGKATTCRLFLLFSGPVVLKGILSDELYKHFLILHTVMRIVTSANPTKEQLLYARLSLRTFVIQSERLYGTTFLSYNVHGLLHLVDDVETLGPVDSYSAFPYENNMRIFNNYCRKPHLTLQQIANRHAEETNWMPVRQPKRNDNFKLMHEHTKGPVPTTATGRIAKQYHRIKCPEFTLRTKCNDSCCILRDSTICIIYNVLKIGQEIKLVVKKFNAVEDFFNIAMPSSLVGYYKCSRLQEQYSLIRLNDVRDKGFLMPIWLPLQFDERRMERIENETYAVATISSVVYY
ncbi:uncharacterized protein [Venturia canescens]|uniref:uncharacterized protein n=1 Tax=Venturia canescens TaxID=32260 RepID=UPI001C9C1DAF|nr:uncharacterized protein LOC122407584 [Venturia canescens]